MEEIPAALLQVTNVTLEREIVIPMTIVLVILCVVNKTVAQDFSGTQQIVAPH